MNFNLIGDLNGSILNSQITVTCFISIFLFYISSGCYYNWRYSSARSSILISAIIFTSKKILHIFYEMVGVAIRKPEVCCYWK